MEPKIIFESNWDFVLSQNHDGSYMFEVICGTVGIYSIDFELNEVEIEAWLQEGETALRHLSYQVRDFPEEYIRRRK
ncbi:MAG: hypothetical protein IPN29_06430 [Saprospiraceae bacterium]|nr:hypothetical protein [Saprospiraceae bacterium]